MQSAQDLKDGVAGSPVLMRISTWLDAQLKCDPDKILDGRAELPRTRLKDVTAGVLADNVRKSVQFSEFIGSWFTPAEQSGAEKDLFCDADRLALLAIELLDFSDARQTALVNAGSDFGLVVEEARGTFIASMQDTVFGELVAATASDDTNWDSEMPARFVAQFRSETEGFWPTFKSLVQNKRQNEASFRHKLDAMILAETHQGVAYLIEVSERDRAENVRLRQSIERMLDKPAKGISEDQARGILRALSLWPELPHEALETAFFGQAEALVDLTAALQDPSNSIPADLLSIRDRALERVQEGDVEGADEALAELDAAQMQIVERTRVARNRQVAAANEAKEAERLETITAAQFKARRAEAARARGALMEAADHYAAAADLVQGFDLEAMAQYRFSEGDVSDDYGKLMPGLAAHARAIKAFEAALQVYTQADMPADVAATQNNLGIALRILGDRQGGEAGARALEQAVEAFEAALEVYTHADMPKDWAATQNNLGTALRSLGDRQGGEAGARALGQAVEAFEAALEVYEQADMPTQWAMTQNNLGIALRSLGDQQGGEAGARAAGQSVEAYEAALQVFKQADMPADWATAQNNLGAALYRLGEWQSGEVGAKALGRAVEAFEAALQVRTQADMPAQWAMTQINLGNALTRLGERQGGEAGTRALGQAVEAYEATLQVYKQADMPAGWATVQNNLGNTLRSLGDRQGGEAGTRALEQAAEAFEAALQVYKQADMPAQWAMTQNNLGIALSSLGERQGGEAGVRSLRQAIGALEEALQVRTQADMPAHWATTQNNLGIALSSLGERQGGEIGARALGQAVVAFEAALQVRTPTDMPVLWAMTQENIGLCREAMADAEGFDARDQLDLAVQAFENSLLVYTSEHMPYDYGTATKSLTRVRAKLAALDAPSDTPQL